MRVIRAFHFSNTLLVGAALLLAILPACSVNVKKESSGEEKQVDIKTPIGGIHVSKGADVADTGLIVYPGARLKEKDSDHDTSANVDISSFGFGLKVVALEYQSDDAPEKVTAFYQDQLKTYGSVLMCRTSGLDVDTDAKKSGSDSHALACGHESGDSVELKVGTKENQHIVAVQRDGKGSKFTLVYVRTHGKDADI